MIYEFSLACLLPRLILVRSVRYLSEIAYQYRITARISGASFAGVRLHAFVRRYSAIYVNRPQFVQNGFHIIRLDVENQ